MFRKVEFLKGKNNSLLANIDGVISFPDRNWGKTHPLPKEGEKWFVFVHRKGNVNFLEPSDSESTVKAQLKEIERKRCEDLRRVLDRKINKAWNEIQGWNKPEPAQSKLVNLNAVKDFQYEITEYKLVDTEWEGDGMRAGDNTRRGSCYVYKAVAPAKDVKVNGGIFPLHQEIKGTMLLNKPEIGEQIIVPASKAIVGYSQHQERRKAENEPYKTWSWFNSIKTLARKEENNGIFIPIESSDGYPELLKLNLDKPFELDYPISGFSDWDSYDQFMNEGGGF